MNYLVRRDPFSELRTTMDRLFDEGFSRPWRLLQTDMDGSMPVDVIESEDGIEVKAALPGFKPEEIEISVTDNVLSIRGEHKQGSEEAGKGDYLRREIRYGSFQRVLSLPAGVDADKAEATFDNGIVKLHLPKVEAVRPRQIKIGTSGNGTSS